jgi:hypothetical protein
MNEIEVERILKTLGEKADTFGIESLTEEERNILVPWWARGVMGNGGCQYLFERRGRSGGRCSQAPSAVISCGRGSV